MATPEDTKKETAPEDRKKEIPTKEAATAPVKAITKWMPTGDDIATGACLILAIVYAIVMVQTECGSAERVLWSLLMAPMASVIFVASIPVTVLMSCVTFFFEFILQTRITFPVSLYDLLGFPWLVAGFRLDQFECVYREAMKWW